MDEEFVEDCEGEDETPCLLCCLRAAGIDDDHPLQLWALGLAYQCDTAGMDRILSRVQDLLTWKVRVTPN